MSSDGIRWQGERECEIFESPKKVADKNRTGFWFLFKFSSKGNDLQAFSDKNNYIYPPSGF